MSGAMNTPILMYHSISEGEGPVCISPATFRRHLAMLADAGGYGISLSDYVASLRGQRELRPGFCVLTFDDGYRDFAINVHPELARRGWSGTVFVPAGRTGLTNDWDPPGNERRPLMDASELRRLACQGGVEIGSHAITHRDLTAMPFDTAVCEIGDSRRMLEDMTGVEVRSFAPPYGSSSDVLRAEIARHYQCAAGTRLDYASGLKDLLDLPRIEMWYFRSPARCRAMIEHRGGWYFAARRMLRWLRRHAVAPDSRGG